MRSWISQGCSTRDGAQELLNDRRKLPLFTCTILCLRRTIVSCQHTTIKISKRYGFQGSFSSGFDHFSPALFFFKSWQNRLRVDDRVLMVSDTTFVYLEAVWNSEVFDGSFLPSKNEGKDLYVQRKKCHRSGYFSHIENFSCEQCNVPFWITLMACRPHADHGGNSHHILESRRLVHRRYLHEVLYHFLIPITKEYVQFFWKQSV